MIAERMRRAKNYFDDLNKRKAHEAETLADLTGWNLQDVIKKAGCRRSRSPSRGGKTSGARDAVTTGNACGSPRPARGRLSRLVQYSDQLRRVRDQVPQLAHLTL